VKRQEEETEEVRFDPELLRFSYPYQRETLLPAKVTATQLKGRAVDEEIAEHAMHTPYIRPLSQPKFRREQKGLTPAERGTATHLVLQYLDFSDMDVPGQVKRLLINGMLTEQQAEAVDCDALERFLASSLAEEIRRGENVLREYRFTLLMWADAYDPKACAEDRILLQGVVDCCFDTPDGLVVVDFKTDSVRTETEVSARAEGYRRQLGAYSLALEQVLERPVARRVLYFLYSGKTVEI
jgi:ATP-dependent helicase/nuclease subunit A